MDIFVTPPYLTCPGCSAERFGVLSVGPHQVTRRCVACGWRGSRELPRLGKQILFVDQSAISNMVRVVRPAMGRTSPHDDFWRSLLLRLDNLVHLQLIACPFTSEHVNESMLDTRLVADLDWLARRLSADMRFEDRFEIERMQLVACAVAWLHGNPIGLSSTAKMSALLGDRTAWLDKMTVRWPVSWPKEVVDTVRTVRDEIHTDLASLYEEWRQSDMAFDQRFRVEALGLGRATIEAEKRRLLRLEAGGGATDRPSAEDRSLEAASGVQRILRAFVKEGLDQHAATVKTVEFLRSDVLLEVPFNRLSAMLTASVAREAQAGRSTKNRPSRGSRSDFAAIATTLPFCDAMFVDNECARFLAQQPLAQEVARYGCGVFSLRSRAELLQYLGRIEASAPSEHLNLVAEIYGPMPSDLSSFTVRT